MNRYNCKNGMMEYYTDPDGYWVTYEDHSKALDSVEHALDNALEDVFDQKYLISDIKSKLSSSNKLVTKLLIVIVSLLAFQFSKYTGLI